MVSAMTAETAPTVTATAAAVAPSATIEPERCALVIASEALNLRNEANEHAAILEWLTRGEVVRVNGSTAGAWWHIEARGVEGYARARYLIIAECEE